MNDRSTSTAGGVIRQHWRRIGCVLRSAVVLVIGAIALARCASPVPLESLPLDDPPAFTRGGERELADRWWTAFDDAALDERIERALAGNFSLMAAWERLHEARSIARRERAGLFPVLDGFAGAERVIANADDSQTSLSIGLQASYELDLWGRIGSAVDAEQLRASATAADYQAAAISLSAEVALTWYELAASQLQLELIESQFETNRTVLQVIENRFAVGQSDSADVLRQRQLVEASREQSIIARSSIEVLEHQLAVLEGRPAQQRTTMQPAQLPAIAPMPATGLPAELLQRRPDVRSALLQLYASDRDVAVAVSEQYPRINLSASLATAADTPSRLFSDWLASLAGELAAPLFDGGRRREDVRRTEAIRRQRLAEYGQTALVAMQDVEDALIREAEQVQRIESLQRQLELASRTYQQLRTQYLNGAADFIDVLIALREQQQIERSVLDAKLERVSFRIALYRALAGSFLTPLERRDMTDESAEQSANGGDSSIG